MLCRVFKILAIFVPKELEEEKIIYNYVQKNNFVALYFLLKSHNNVALCAPQFLASQYINLYYVYIYSLYYDSTEYK